MSASGSTNAPALDLGAVNALDREDFVRLLGPVFEHSPWVAAGAAGSRPFDSVEALHTAMMDVVRDCRRRSGSISCARTPNWRARRRGPGA
ncbi:hypothetical protein O1L60_26760 [Streptomyces diastatochromogenes]|nr:hypothetical protein [Streptomyces diastatochromogenes]